jgi:predicted metalloendopeptidase
LIDLYAEQVGGLYDDRTGRLYVTDLFPPDSRVGRMILAHEICHALRTRISISRICHFMRATMTTPHLPYFRLSRATPRF